MCGGGANGGAVYNCCFSGTLSIVGAKGNRDRTAVITNLGESSIINGYYLYGAQGNTGITPEAAATVFYKTSDNENVKTSAIVVEELNAFIESNESGINTNGWCKWVLSDDNVPVLDFSTEWNGTEWTTVR